MAAVAVAMTSQGQRVWVQGLLPNALLMSSLQLLKFGPKLRRIRHLWIAFVSPSFSLFFFCFFFLFYGRQSQVPCDVSTIFVADLALVLLVYNLLPSNTYDTAFSTLFPISHFPFSISNFHVIHI